MIATFYRLKYAFRGRRWISLVTNEIRWRFTFHKFHIYVGVRESLCTFHPAIIKQSSETCEPPSIHVMRAKRAHDPHWCELLLYWAATFLDGMDSSKPPFLFCSNCQCTEYDLIHPPTTQKSLWGWNSATFTRFLFWHLTPQHHLDHCLPLLYDSPPLEQTL